MRGLVGFDFFAQVCGKKYYPIEIIQIAEIANATPAIFTFDNFSLKNKYAITADKAMIEILL